MGNNLIENYNSLMSKNLDRYHRALKELLVLLDKRDVNTPPDINYSNLKKRFEEDLSDLLLYEDDLLLSQNSYNLKKEYFKSTLLDFSNRYETCLQSIVKLLDEKKEYYLAQIDLAVEDNSPTSKPRMKLELCIQNSIMYKSDLANIKIMIDRIEHKYDELTKSTYESVVSGYNKAWKWPDKLTHILRKEEHVLSLSQMLDRILEYEPNFKNKNGDTRVLKKNLSGILKYYCNEGLFKRTESGHNEIYQYGLPEWFDSNNSVHLQFSQASQN